MAADFSGPILKRNLHCWPQRILAVRACCKSYSDSTRFKKSSAYNWHVKRKSETGNNRTPGEGHRVAAAGLLTKRLNRSGENTHRDQRHQHRSHISPFQPLCHPRESLAHRLCLQTFLVDKHYFVVFASDCELHSTWPPLAQFQDLDDWSSDPTPLLKYGDSCQQTFAYHFVSSSSILSDHVFVRVWRISVKAFSKSTSLLHVTCSSFLSLLVGCTPSLGPSLFTFMFLCFQLFTVCATRINCTSPLTCTLLPRATTIWCILPSTQLGNQLSVLHHTLLCLKTKLFFDLDNQSSHLNVLFFARERSALNIRTPTRVVARVHTRISVSKHSDRMCMKQNWDQFQWLGSSENVLNQGQQFPHDLKERSNCGGSDFTRNIIYNSTRHGKRLTECMCPEVLDVDGQQIGMTMDGDTQQQILCTNTSCEPRPTIVEHCSVLIAAHCLVCHIPVSIQRFGTIRLNTLPGLAKSQLLVWLSPWLSSNNLRSSYDVGSVGTKVLVVDLESTPQIHHNNRGLYGLS